jgi:hypothetical protein
MLQAQTSEKSEKPLPKWFRLCKGAEYIRQSRLENGLHTTLDIEKQERADYLLYVRSEGPRRLSEELKAIDEELEGKRAGLIAKRARNIAAATTYEHQILARAEGLLDIFEGMKDAEALAEEKRKEAIEKNKEWDKEWILKAPRDAEEFERWRQSRRAQAEREGRNESSNSSTAQNTPTTSQTGRMLMADL